MRKFVPVTLLLSLITLASTAWAASSTKGVISEIRRTGSNTYVYLDVESGTNCGGSNRFYYTDSSAAAEDWFRLVSSAFLSGRTVWFVLNDNSDCKITEVRVYR